MIDKIQIKGDSAPNLTITDGDGNEIQGAVNKVLVSPIRPQDRIQATLSFVGVDLDIEAGVRKERISCPECGHETPVEEWVGVSCNECDFVFVDLGG